MASADQPFGEAPSPGEEPRTSGGPSNVSGIIGRVEAQTAELRTSVAGVVSAEAVTLQRSAAGTVVARSAAVDRSHVGVLVSPVVRGDVHTWLDMRTAFAAGLGLAVGSVIVSLIRGVFRR